MRIRHIEHLTLQTGHQRRSYRDEVGDDIIAMLRPLLERVAAGERVEVPGAVEPRGCTMTGAIGRSRSLLLTVSGPAYEGRSETPILPPLATIGIAPDSLASAALWREWRGGERDDRTPRAPWCAVDLWPGLALHPGAAEWLGDYERCCAWAWCAPAG